MYSAQRSRNVSGRGPAATLLEHHRQFSQKSIYCTADRSSPPTQRTPWRRRLPTRRNISSSRHSARHAEGNKTAQPSEWAACSWRAVFQTSNWTNVHPAAAHVYEYHASGDCIFRCPSPPRHGCSETGGAGRYRPDPTYVLFIAKCKHARRASYSSTTCFARVKRTAVADARVSVPPLPRVPSAHAPNLIAPIHCACPLRERTSWSCAYQTHLHGVPGIHRTTRYSSQCHAACS